MQEYPKSASLQKPRDHPSEMSDRIHYPFEADVLELNRNIDQYVDATISSLRSYYLIMPRGGDFVEFEEFARAYRTLDDKTKTFSEFSDETVREAVEEDPLVFVVLRCILGFSPPELAHLASEESGLAITQGFARSVDKQARAQKTHLRGRNAEAREKTEAMLVAARRAIMTGPASAPSDGLHRLYKADTEQGIVSLRRLAGERVPYPVLLYERFLGRPFASHRDAVSEKVGDIVEDEIERQLREHSVPFYKAGRAERIPGFDQAPDFLIPSEDEPRAVIEAKLTEDDGTARDKVTRVQHLREISDQGGKFEVIACIDGRGFSIRREDMKKLLLATNGKVFTMASMDRLVETTALKRLKALSGLGSD